jgi:hypothetical protein
MFIELSFAIAHVGEATAGICSDRYIAAYFMYLSRCRERMLCYRCPGSRIYVTEFYNIILRKRTQYKGLRESKDLSRVD